MSTGSSPPCRRYRTANGRLLGQIDQAPLADAGLAAFLGPKPGSPAMKQALLKRRR